MQEPVGLSGIMYCDTILRYISAEDCSKFVSNQKQLTMRSKGIVPHFCYRFAVLLFHSLSCFLTHNLRAAMPLQSRRRRTGGPSGRAPSPRVSPAFCDCALASRANRATCSGSPVHNEHTDCNNTLRR